MVAAGEVLYTKQKHGSLPLTVLASGFLLGEKKYDTERGLFEDLYGKRTKMTLEKYFPHLKQPQPSYDLASALTDTCGVKKGIDLENRRKKLKKESKQFNSIEEAYQAGFLRGFWEGAGESFTYTQMKEDA